jgi:hypothetical protein
VNDSTITSCSASAARKVSVLLLLACDSLIATLLSIWEKSEMKKASDDGAMTGVSMKFVWTTPLSGIAVIPRVLEIAVWFSLCRIEMVKVAR